jgi:hypothetical protein
MFIEVSQNHELHRLWGDHYNATNVSCVRSENARRHGKAVGRIGHARYQHTLAERHVTNINDDRENVCTVVHQRDA